MIAAAWKGLGIALNARLNDIADSLTHRNPDVVIGSPGDPYLLRWHAIPRNRWFNIYVHRIIRSDDDRALHDHPWVNLSVILDGGYFEHTIAAGGIEHRAWRGAGTWKVRLPSAAHRLEVGREGALTLFITGPRVRVWGFHCPQQGWIPWTRFVASGDAGEVGAGCEG